MSTTIKAATETDSETMIFGTGFPANWSWWVSLDRDWEYPAEFPFDAPAGWMWRVTIEDPTRDGETITKEIRHKDLMAAFRKISGKDFEARASLKKQCRNMLLNVDEADMDAVDADAVLQVAMLGDIAFG
ncbi:hypothetical protein NONI108955_11100 [Nocardia ninae]|uniref:Uncharacterized protein n=1 Tax=Nocardia ninae NBRC 108245 TaxID=1210091 RepID=A0A511MMV3_9NOCA|nr:hypothetical protein [Nocardia ninae]GEM41954.1 hypothetical protein NN4_64730 [Nocardia ninae NBRC 108245]